MKLFVVLTIISLIILSNIVPVSITGNTNSGLCDTWALERTIYIKHGWPFESYTVSRNECAVDDGNISVNFVGIFANTLFVATLSMVVFHLYKKSRIRV